VSLGVVIKGPEGIVLAADSRITLAAQKEGSDLPPLVVNFDNATKLLTFSGENNKYVGAVTYGVAVIGLRTAHSYIPEFELQLSDKPRLHVEKIAKMMSDFYLARWKEMMPPDYAGPPMNFIVGGFDPGAAYGSVFLFEIPGNPIPQPRNSGEKEFGMTWGGQLQISSRLVHGFDPELPNILQKRLNLRMEDVEELKDFLRKNLEFAIPYNLLALQDCVDLAIFLVRTTISAQRLAVEVRGVGGAIDVAVISRTNGIEYVQRKRIRGENSTEDGKIE
jgi:hypothetical protein